MIQQNWFWLKMTGQVQVWIPACEGCQSWKPAQYSHHTPLTDPGAGWTVELSAHGSDVATVGDNLWE